MQEMKSWVGSLGWEDPLKEETATHSSILAWRIPWTEGPGGLQSVGSQRVGHDWSDWAHTRYFPLDCEHIKDNSRLLLCLYSPKVCAGHAVSFQQMFVDLLMIKDVRKDRKEESEKIRVLRTEENYLLWTGKEVVTAELFLQENVLLSLIRRLWHWGENEKTWGWSKSINQLHWL